MRGLWAITVAFLLWSGPAQSQVQDEPDWSADAEPPVVDEVSGSESLNLSSTELMAWLTSPAQVSAGASFLDNARSWGEPEAGEGSVFAYSVGEDLRWLPLLNTSATNVTCQYRSTTDGFTMVAEISKGTRGKLMPAHDIGAGHYWDDDMREWISGLKVSCRGVKGGKVYSGLRWGGRYVIQQAPTGGLELVQVVAIY